MADLFPYQGIFKPLVLPPSVFIGQSCNSVHHAPTSLVPTDVIVNVLAYQYVISPSGGCQCLLVRWEGHHSIDDN